jgi:serine/threonine protein kinase
MGANPPAQAPRRIGRFELLRLLGRGTQGIVHLARDTRLDRLVALKSLQLGEAGETERNRGFKTLLDEAMIVSRLQHVNLVAVFDAGEEGGVPYVIF